MSDILTESFCERCGTQYTFGRVDDRRRNLASVVTVARGLRNYVLSNDPLSTAFARARQEDIAPLLDAFDRAFRFCIECRQYTCLACWNEEAGRCQTCAPLPESPAVAEIEVEVAGEVETAPAVIGVVPAQADVAPAQLDVGFAELAAVAADAPPDWTEPDGDALIRADENAPLNGQLALPVEELAEDEPRVPLPVEAVEEPLEDHLGDHLDGPLMDHVESPAQEAVVGVPTAFHVSALPPVDVRAAKNAGSLNGAPPEEARGSSDTASRANRAPGACPACGLSVSRAARFCRRCGAPQDEEAMAAS